MTSTKSAGRCPFAWVILQIGLLCLSAHTAFAQGSIFGAVQNPDLSVPANGQISFFGFLDDKDNEIRIDGAVGADYDNGNWYDDFQNYLSASAGSPYDFYFFNTVTYQSYHLESLIPSNSFQREDVILSSVGWPITPTGLKATVVTSTSVRVSWNRDPNLTYHVYRRLESSGGSFMRVDNPAGLLSDPGVADSFYVDTTLDGVSTYQYLIIAQDIVGLLSPHSDVVVMQTVVGCCLGTRGDINGDGVDLDIVDLTAVVDFLFGTPGPIPCPDESDANGDGANGGLPDIVDLTFVVDWLFGSPPTIVSCP
ncbi:MAG: hypothetical protein ACE5FH_01295 [Candidatus Zixiibacteriota bacterium]